MTRFCDDWFQVREELTGPVAMELRFCTRRPSPIGGNQASCGTPQRMIVNETTWRVPLARVTELDGFPGSVWVIVCGTNQVGTRTCAPESNELKLGNASLSTGTVRFIAGSSGAPGARESALTLAAAPALEGVVAVVEGFIDLEVGVASFEWCLGTSSGADDILPCSQHDGRLGEIVLADSATQLVGAAAGHNAQAILSVTVCNAHGDCQSAISSPLLVDAVPPSGGYVVDGLYMGRGAVFDWAKVYGFDCTSGEGEGGVASDRCQTTLLLGNGVVEAAVLSPLRALQRTGAAVQAEAPLRLLRKNALAASWGGFTDALTGVARVELCFERRDSTEDSKWHRCSDVPLEGMAVLTGLDSDLITEGDYIAHVTAYDRVGHMSSVSSVGALVVAPAATSAAPSTAVNVSSCDALSFEWATPHFLSDCEEGSSAVWRLCTRPTNCTAAIALPGNVITQGGNSVIRRASALDAGMLSGRFYYLSVLISCPIAGVSTEVISDPFACDADPPEVLAEPTLRSEAGLLALAAGGVARVEWEGVFASHDSPIVSFAVCLRAQTATCDGATSWQDAGTAVSALLDVPRATRSTGITNYLLAVVRATSLFGLHAMAMTAVVRVFASAPALEYVAVAGHSSADSGPHCALVDLDVVPVAVVGTDAVETADEAQVIYRVTAWHVATNESLGAIELAPPLRRGLLATPGLSALPPRALVRFELTTTNPAGLSNVSALTCVVDGGGNPIPGAFFLQPWGGGAPSTSGPLRRAEALHVPENDKSELTLCWEGWEAPPSGMDYALSIASSGAAPITVQLDADSNIPEDLMVADPINGRRCHTLNSVELVGGSTHRVSLHAVSQVGRASALAELALSVVTAGPTAPASGAALRVYTGGPSARVQQSSCCLRLSWQAWVGAQSAVARYSVCLGDEAEGNCLNVGMARRVLLRATTGCPCDPPSAEAADRGDHGPWSTFEWGALSDAFAAGNETRVVLLPFDSLGLRSEQLAFAPIRAQPAMDSPELSIVPPQALTDLDLPSCIVSAAAAHPHPALVPLALEWPWQPNVYAYSACVLEWPSAASADLSARGRCEAAAGNATRLTLAPLAVGSFQLRLTATSLSGVEATSQLLVSVRNPPPPVTAVRLLGLSEGASYPRCEWSPPAHAAEAALESAYAYHVSLVAVGNGGACHEPEGALYGGAVLATGETYSH